MATKENTIIVDLELKKAFQELQNKMITTTQQLKVSDAQIETLKRQITHSKLVTKEIAALPSETRVFQGVGRMFLLQPIPTIQKNLDAKMKASEEKIKTIDTNKGYLERSIKESEDSLRELVLSKKGR
ncbi:prefoldin subunit 1 [Patella vulgata]|uniref:prefoldin subunit 1 n=1 Tax=Patella vulgata TaxID=6465 RepID=UPI00217F9D62|nr:prefoldin subunit 1 [Patella vulgata]